jgi:hypothetical protein
MEFTTKMLSIFVCYLTLTLEAAKLEVASVHKKGLLKYTITIWLIVEEGAFILAVIIEF